MEVGILELKANFIIEHGWEALIIFCAYDLLDFRAKAEETLVLVLFLGKGDAGYEGT
jgi:hypothetical protein